MRELTFTIKFNTPSLGNQKDKNGTFRFQRNPSGKIIFLPTWHQSNMRFASQMLSKHHELVSKICWNIDVDVQLRPDSFTKVFYTKGNSSRYSLHESILAGQNASINCVVPKEISEQDFWQLLQLAGQYKGLSPYRPGEYGHYDVVSINIRR